MTRRLIISRVGVIKGVSAKAELKPQQHPPVGPYGSTHAYPRQFDTDICTGSDHITYNRVKHWSVTSGVFDPFSRSDAILKRLNSVDTETAQTGLSLDTGTYQIGLTGAGIIQFHNGGSYSWGSGSLVHGERLVDQNTTVTFINQAPDSISLKLINSVDEIVAISLKNSAGEEMLLNGTFDDVEEHFYDIDAWYTASTETDRIPTDVLGWLQGYNDSLIYTVFE